MLTIAGYQLKKEIEKESITFLKPTRYGHISYCKNHISFDSETSHIKEIGWIYQWCYKFQNQIIVGRTPQEFVESLLKISDLYSLHQNEKIVIYIHNLSYDFTYLNDFLVQYGETKIFAIDSHKILKVSWRNFEFRCSWILSNMSLEKWANFLNTKHMKKVGEIDYSKIRFQDTELSFEEWEYQLYDVLTLDDCIVTTLNNDNDTLATIPLTSTGYVRRDFRNAMRKNPKNYKDFQKWSLDVNTYKMCRRAFAGGYTHGNRFLAGKTIKANIGHFDFKSHYPSRQQLSYFPEQFLLYSVNKISESEYFELCKKYCVIANFYVKNIRLKAGITAPYIQQSKILNPNKSQKFWKENNFDGTDNGRIVNAEGLFAFCYTELDWDIINRQYDFDAVVIEKVYIAERTRMNPEFLSMIDKYFTVKETETDEYYRMKDKNKLNAGYGMCVCDPVRDEIIFDLQNQNEKAWKKENVHLNDFLITEKLNKYYNSRNSFLTHQQGIYVTAQARYELLKLIESIGYEYFIYADTDSIFFIMNENAIKVINEYNEKIIAQNKKLGLGVKNRKGGISYYGTFEDEKDNIVEFRFLHAKCYAFVNKEGKLNVTIAGVTKDNKKTGKDKVTIAQELGSIDRLHEDFIFKECGGTRTVYSYNGIHKDKIEEHEVLLASSAVILPTEKKLSSLESIEIYDTV